jgi:hypothetical protein
LKCRNGHPWGPGHVTISWAPCDSPAALADPGRGHLVVHCHGAGCTETWQVDADALVGAFEDGSRRASADRDSPQTMAMRDTAWTLLMQAQEYQRFLLTSSHPSASRVAGFRSWIQDCVMAVDEAQRLGALIAPDDEAAPHVEEVATRIAAVVDTFHIYASMLKRFRSADQTAVVPPQSRPLAAVADDERLLLGCRATLRESMQQLIAALQSYS